MRLFYAITLTAEIKENLAQLQERLKAAQAEVKWVPSENLHLTVAFLGDHGESLLPEFYRIGEETVKETAPFRIRVAGGSFFPKRGPQIKTLWAGLREGGDLWKVLVKRTEPHLIPLGVPREGGLQPHITLGRVKGEKNLETLRAAIDAEAETECGEMTAESLVLIQSFLDPQGATYKTLQSWQFIRETSGA